MNEIELDATCDAIRITVTQTNGCKEACICEVRVY